ncbi:MAG TPA: metallophosphoesterase [Lacipirellulaceae bacterium]|jgi:DNA repair exonuclease SbcCD nuclease subunit|nr:metallophosphoesterase [Lacipirellulaceae bacterium]
MTQPLRLVHASDLHLELPIYGLSEVPDHLRELLIDAPYHAAEQVFETALAEDADAVLLAGDVLNVDRAGPPAIVLLLDQFARLAERKIPVYWAGGAVDPPDSWPRSVALPPNVHVFPIGRVESLDLTRAGETIARIQGTSCPEGGTVDARGFHRDAHGLFTVGVAYGTNDSAGHEGDRVHYMALGGRHLQQTVDEQPGIAHFCGSPQGRGPKETGPHGCTVVTVDETARAKTKFVATDSVRWIEQSLEVTATTKQEQLHDRLVERLEKLQAQHPGVELFVRWNIRGTGPLVNRLRPNSLADELLVDLRRRFGQRSPVAWSASITCESALSVPAEWYDQETCLGDFLRVVRDFELHETPFDLRPFLPSNVRDEFLESIAHLDSKEANKELLSRASKLGIDLLTLPLEEGDITETADINADG